MSNMSYCRFENTLQDLRDCEANLFDDDLSESEKKCRAKLVELCREIVTAWDDVMVDEEEG